MPAERGSRVSDHQPHDAIGDRDSDTYVMRDKQPAKPGNTNQAVSGSPG